ncbi:glycosyltransferase family 2 protein [Candidatus Nanopelagicales bacterium]|nr:glycosyltransferase family 2 protein [Candidatus Nanopelagicales bacterium]
MTTSVSHFWGDTSADSVANPQTGGSGTPGGEDQAQVDAVLVTHNGARWLPRTLASLAKMTRKPDSLWAVDTGSQDNSVALVESSGLVNQIVGLDARTGFGSAVAAGVEQSVRVDADQEILDLTDSKVDLTDSKVTAGLESETADAAAPDSPSLASQLDVVDLSDGADSQDGVASVASQAPQDGVVGQQNWIWILHDDCEVAPDALTQLLSVAQANPEAWVVGPKLHKWRNTGVVAELGFSYTSTGRRITGIESKELDQGQYDHRSKVFAVDSCGMLVRRDVWEQLGGFTKAQPLFGDDADFCYRVQRAGGLVLVAPKAVVNHRAAGASGRRAGLAIRGNADRAQRRSANLNSLAQAPLWRLPFTGLRVMLAGAFGAFLAMFGLASGSVWDRLVAGFAPVLQVRMLWRIRRGTAKTKAVPRREVRRRRKALSRNGSYWQEAVPRFLDHGSNNSMQSIRRRGRVAGNWLAAVALPLFLVSMFATRELWFGSGQIHGGALLPTPSSAGGLFASFTAAWHDVGLGSDVASPPFLAFLAGVALVFLGSATAAVQIMMLLAPVLAGTSAFWALRGFVSGFPRVAAALAYGLLPATVAAVGSGRLATVALAILLPLVLRGIVGLVGLVPDKLKFPTWPRTILVSLGMAILLAFSPPSGIALLALAFAWILVTPGRRTTLPRWAFVAVFPLVLLWPWSPYLLTNPGLLFLDVGVNNAALAADPSQAWQLAFLAPGGPAAPSFWYGGLLLALGLLATLTRGVSKVAAFAWSGIAVGLGLGVWQLMFAMPVPWNRAGVAAWPGSATILIGIGLILLVVAAANRPQPRVEEDAASPVDPDPTRFRRSVGVAGPSLMLASALLVAGWWMLEQDQIIEKSDPVAVSPFVLRETLSEQAPRVLLVSGAGRDQYEYLIFSGNGPSLGDSEVAPDFATTTAINDAISRLTSGDVGEADLAILGNAAIKYVQTTVATDRGLSRQLDAVPGLTRVSTANGLSLWEISGWLPRARALGPDGAASVPVTFTAAGAAVVDTVIDGETQLNEVTIAATPDPIWQGQAGETELVADDGGTLQRFTAPQDISGPATLSVAPDATARQLSLLVPVAGLVLVALAALVAARRAIRRSEDPKQIDLRKRRADSPTSDVGQGEPDPETMSDSGQGEPDPETMSDSGQVEPDPETRGAR